LVATERKTFSKRPIFHSSPRPPSSDHKRHQFAQMKLIYRHRQH
jgi:hypothetical protein